MIVSALKHAVLLSLSLCLPGCASLQANFLARPFDASGQLSQDELTPSGLRVSGGEMDDLTTWYQATLRRNEVREQNRQVLLGLIALGGATIAAASGDEAVRAVGGVASLGAVTALTVSDVKESIDALERPAMFPESHLLAGPFAVPPALSVKKWITLATSGGSSPCVSGMTLSYEVEGRAREHVYLKFKVDSEWQARACGSLFHARGGN